MVPRMEKSPCCSAGCHSKYRLARGMGQFMGVYLNACVVWFLVLGWTTAGAARIRPLSDSAVQRSLPAEPGQD